MLFLHMKLRIKKVSSGVWVYGVQSELFLGGDKAGKSGVEPGTPSPDDLICHHESKVHRLWPS